jgi:hypothetical protein
MKQYTIYFEIFGKKLKINLYAKSMADAQQKLLKKKDEAFKILKVELSDDTTFLKDIFPFL